MRGGGQAGAAEEGGCMLVVTLLAKFLIDELHKKNTPWQYAVISVSFTDVTGNVGETERRGAAHVGFTELYHLQVNCTADVTDLKELALV